MSRSQIRVAARTKRTWCRGTLLALASLFVLQVSYSTSFVRIKIEPWLEVSIVEHRDLDLVDICPNTLEEFSTECQSALDDHFAELPLELSATSWIIQPNRLTYGRVFEDPIGDRKRVIEALQRKDCQLKDGEGARWGLKETCHADAFANFSVFLWTCSKSRNLQRLHNAIVDPSSIAHPASDPVLYKRKMQSRIVKLLEARWFRGQCDKYEVSEIRIDEHRDQESYDILRSTAKRLGDVWDQSSTVPEVFVLKSLAARFGDESAAVLYGSTGDRKGDSWRKHIQAVWPWKSMLEEIRGNTMLAVIDGPPTTSRRLHLGILVAVSLQESGLEFDWNRLVRKVCTRKNPTQATCQLAIEELNLSLEWDQEIELEALDMFESVSIELDLYD